MLLFSQEVMSNSLQPLGLQHSRLPHPLLSPGVCSSSCPLSRWCHPTISSSAALFCLQCFPASGSFPVSWLSTSGGQTIGASASASVFPMNIQDWFPLGLTGWISLQSKGLSKVFSNTTVQKHQFFSALLCLWSSSHNHTWLLERPQSWLYRPVSAKWCLCFFNTLSRFVKAFLLRSNHLLIPRLQSPSAVILEPKKRKSVTVSIFSPSICHEVMGPDAIS